MMTPEELARLLDGHAAALALFARQWCAGADDVVQEAFCKLAAQRSPPRDAVAWLFRVVRNGAVSAGRGERRRRKYESAAARDSGWFAVAAADGLDAAEAVAALQSLPAEVREVIVAHLWGGLTFAQLGGVLGTSTATAFRRYRDGVTRLRQLLGEPCPPT